MKTALVTALTLLPSILVAQDPPSAIQDNSFLIEEAYNQEPGVVQHISFFSRPTRGGSWSYGFTQEWPVPSQRHQLSITIPVEHADGNPSLTGLGDIAVNYRYQLVGNGDTRLAISPRISMLFPTGSVAKGFGAGSAGFQVNLPVSFMLTPRLATHWNAGGSFLPKIRNPAGLDGHSKTWTLGQSFIYLLAPTLNLMLETVWNEEENSVGGPAVIRHDLVVSPGIRYAFNFRSGLQIVPGIAVPIGVGPSSGTSLILYLSFEHAFKKAS